MKDSTYGRAAWSDRTTQGTNITYPITHTEGTYVFSVYVKAGTLDGCHLRVDAINPNPSYNPDGTVHNPIYWASANADLTNGTINNNGGIEDVGNGWYRIWRYMEGKIMAVRVYPMASPANGGFGNVEDPDHVQTGSIFVMHPQFEAGTIPTAYEAQPV